MEADLLSSIRDLLRSELEPIRAELGSVKGELGSVKGELGSVKGELGSVKGELGSVKAGLGRLEKAQDKLNKGQGLLWESHLRPLVKEQFGRSFSKQLSAKSLQYLAKRVCSATGWTEGKEVDQIFEVAQKLSTALISGGTAEKLLRAVAAASSGVAADADASLQIWAAGTVAWVAADGSLDRAAVGRSLGELPDAQGCLKSKLGSLLTFLSDPCLDSVPTSCLPTLNIVPQTLDAHAGHTSPEQYLTTCDSPGVMLALFESGAMGVSIGKGRLFEEWDQLQLPFRQVQMDVRGKLRYFQELADVDVGEIKRSADTYAHAKEQLVQHAKLFRWAMQTGRSGVASVRCTGHLFVPVVNLRDEASLPEDSLEDGVSILVHGL